MALSSTEQRQLRYLLKKAGRLDLIKQLLQPPRHGGMPARELDDQMLVSVELFVRVAMRDHGKSRTEALQWFAEAFAQAGAKLAISPAAYVARLRRKLKARGLDRQPIEKLFPFSETDPAKQQFPFAEADPKKCSITIIPKRSR